ncbi:MAG: DUF4349 domain-containing protein [Lachnospiraceae bacterium]|nr:DUF4349 domain-containing protein [Lachnospiraceae bacterium]
MKKKVLLVIGLVGALLLGACGASNKASDMMVMPEASYESESYYKEMSNGSSYDGFGYTADVSMSDSYKSEYDGDYVGDAEEPMVESTSGTATGESYNTESEKLIRTIRMRLQTKEFDSLLSYLEGKVAEAGGYVQNSQIYGNAADSYGYRSADLTYRIPQNNLDAFVAGVGENATVVYKTENAENVTLQYADTESRLKALEIEQERFLALLEQANDVESIITIEQHLTELRYEIESYASQLRVYDNRVNYSTVTLEVSEVNRIVPVEENPTLLTRMKDGFVETWYDLQDGAANFMVWLVTNFLYLIIWAIILTVAVIVIKKVWKKKIKGNGSDKAEHVLEQTEEEEHDRMDPEK